MFCFQYNLTALQLAIFQKDKKTSRNEEKIAYELKKSKGKTDKSEHQSFLIYNNTVSEKDVGQDLLNGNRGLRSSQELSLDRIKCAEILLNIQNSSKRPYLLFQSSPEHFVYYDLLLRNYDIQESLKTPRKRIEEAQLIQEREELFEKYSSIVEVANKYPEVKQYRAAFSMLYFANESIPYFIWLILLVALAIMVTTQNSSSNYFFSAGLSNSFVTTPTDPWNNVATSDDFWAYLNGPLVDSLFLQPDPDYYLIGGVQLLQVRMKPTNCQSDTEFSGKFQNCYSNSLQPSTQPYGNSGQYTYSTNQRESFEGIIASYPGNGFVSILDTTNNQTFLNNVQALEPDWIDDQTRAIAVTFSIYNFNLDIIGVGTLVLEFPVSGATFTNSYFTILPSYSLSTAGKKVLIALEIVVVLFFLYAFPFTEFKELKERRNKLNYLKDLWNYYEWGIILLGLTLIILHIYNLVTYSHSDFLCAPTKYSDFTYLATRISVERTLWSVFVLICLVRALKFLVMAPLAVGPTTLSIIETLWHRSFVVFIILLIYILLAFGIAYHLAFGNDILNTRTLLQSFLSIIGFIFGGFDSAPLQQDNPTYGPIFFFLASITIAMIFMVIIIIIYFFFKFGD